MPTTQSVLPSTPLPGAMLLNKAAVRVQAFFKGLVVTVESTEEMSDVWKLYRLARNSDSVQPAVVRQLAAEAGR